MLIDTSVTIAYKCASCGSFDFFGISLFTIKYKKMNYLTCHCGKSSIAMKKENENAVALVIPCIGCGAEHNYSFSKRNILLGESVVFKCPETGMQICFIGKDEVVRKKVDKLEKEFDELMDMYGYESYFKNTRVMIDILDRIHDIASEGNLFCECGNTDIELVLFSDSILLRCVMCGRDIKIPASKNMDLKEILVKNQILITEDVLV